MYLELSRRRWTLALDRVFDEQNFSKRGWNLVLIIKSKWKTVGMIYCLCFLVQKFWTVLQNLRWISWIPWVYHVFSCWCLGSIITYTYVWFHLVCLFYKKGRRKRRQKDKKDAFSECRTWKLNNYADPIKFVSAWVWISEWWKLCIQYEHVLKIVLWEASLGN